MNTPCCPDCQVEMEEGFILDLQHYNQPDISKWHPGPPRKVPIFLWATALEVKTSKSIGVQSFRCPNCGLLREYALQPPSK